MANLWTPVAGGIVALLLLANCGEPTLDDRVEELRVLEQRGRWAQLIETLDRSYVDVPGGWFAMGSADGRPDEQPRRQVYVDDYRIGRYEVTNLQYAAFLAVEAGRPPAYWALSSRG